MNVNFKTGDKVFVLINRSVFAVANSCPNYPQPPDEMFVAPAVVCESSLVKPGDRMVAATVDLSNAPDAKMPVCDARFVLDVDNVFNNEDAAKAAAQEYNESHTKTNKEYRG